MAILENRLLHLIFITLPELLTCSLIKICSQHNVSPVATGEQMVSGRFNLIYLLFILCIWFLPHQLFLYIYVSKEPNTQCPSIPCEKSPGEPYLVIEPSIFVEGDLA
jgi:hypothetical protein